MEVKTGFSRRITTRGRNCRNEVLDDKSQVLDFLLLTIITDGAFNEQFDAKMHYVIHTDLYAHCSISWRYIALEILETMGYECRKHAWM